MNLGYDAEDVRLDVKDPVHDEDIEEAISTPPSTPPPSHTSFLSSNFTPKRPFSIRTPTGSPSSSPKKKRERIQVNSSVRNALELAEMGEPKRGLLNFFSKGTAEDTTAYWVREEEKRKERESHEDVMARWTLVEKLEHERELGKLRQQKRRMKVKAEEIRAGERTPKGSKRKVNLQIKTAVDGTELLQQVVDLELEDSVDPTVKRLKTTLAEESRPGRAFTLKAHQKKPKPQGRKLKNQPRPARYTNWLTPFCWVQITIVAKQVGWKMSASEIAQKLKQRDPITFAKIHRNTIDGWIDRSGNKPCWTDSVLRRTQDGNNPGHNKGGRRGILV